MEMTAILFIPYLVKAAAVHKGSVLPDGIAAPESQILSAVLQMIFARYQL